MSSAKPKGLPNFAAAEAALIAALYQGVCIAVCRRISDGPDPFVCVLKDDADVGDLIHVQDDLDAGYPHYCPLPGVPPGRSHAAVAGP